MEEHPRSLACTGFRQVRFRGTYPIRLVDFRDDAFPVKIPLEAFSPFAPLDLDGSSLPLTVMRYTLCNASTSQIEVPLAVGDKISVKIGETIIPATLKRTAKRILVTLEPPLKIAAGEMLAVSAS